MSNELDVDALAQEIRRVDGKHDLGAGQLAEALMPFLIARAHPPTDAGVSEAMVERATAEFDRAYMVVGESKLAAMRCAIEAALSQNEGDRK